MCTQVLRNTIDWLRSVYGWTLYLYLQFEYQSQPQKTKERREFKHQMSLAVLM